MIKLKHDLRYLKDLMEANAEMKTFLGHMFWKKATACIWHEYDRQAFETYCSHEEVSREIYQEEVCPDCPHYKVSELMEEDEIDWHPGMRVTKDFFDGKTEAKQLEESSGLGENYDK